MKGIEGKRGWKL